MNLTLAQSTTFQVKYFFLDQYVPENAFALVGVYY